jgi:hypothetical protein
MAREPFDWLADPETRRGGFRRIHSAVARGWLDGPRWAQRRADLVHALARLIADPATTPREVIQIGRIFAAMGKERRD